MITYLFRIYRKIKSTTPAYTAEAIFKLVPTVLLLAVFDVFGLLMILPIIKIIIEPTIIYENQYLLYLFTKFNLHSEILFSMVLLSIIVLFYIIKNLITYYGTRWQSHLIFSTAAKLTIHQFELFLFKPFQYHANKESGNLLRSIIEIPFNFASGILLPFVIIINELLVGMIIFVIITIYNPYLFLSVLLFVSPFFVLYTIIHKNRLKKISVDRDKSHTKMFVKGKQALAGFREILLFNKIDYFKLEFQHSVIRFSEAFSKLSFYNAYFPRIVEGLAVLSIFGVFVTSYILNYDMKLISSFLAAFALAAYRLIPSINKIILSYNNIKSTEFVFEHLEQTQEINSTYISDQQLPDTTEIHPMPFEKELVIKNLTFKYANDDNDIFKNLNLKIIKGQTVGIIGDSGSGKTTLINILLMLLDNYSGEIMIDGIKLSNKNKMEWYRTISYVPQNIILLAGTILENITFGIKSELVNYEKLKGVIAQSQLREFVDKLPDGINTDIGENGLKISGGQRQRIGIARALYQEGSILVFDEATSSLDKSTEVMLSKSIKDLSDKKYTIIIIAHRLESLRYCDSIYRIEKGIITGPRSFKDIS